VKVNFDVTDYLKFYDYLIVQRNEELSSYQNQGIYVNLTIPANNPFNPFGIPLTTGGFNQSLPEFGPQTVLLCFSREEVLVFRLSRNGSRDTDASPVILPDGVLATLLDAFHLCRWNFLLRKTPIS
jgi:hypothetical protein